MKKMIMMIFNEKIVMIVMILKVTIDSNIFNENEMMILLWNIMCNDSNVVMAVLKWQCVYIIVCG